jgi:hypothetical protein
MYDRLGLKPGQDFLRMVSRSSRQKAKRFLRAVTTDGRVLDCELSIELDSGNNPLFLSAAKTSRGLFLVGMHSPFSLTALPKLLVKMMPVDAEFSPEPQAFTTRREPKARLGQGPGIELENATAGSPQSVAQEAEPKTGRGGKIHSRRMLAHDLRNPLSGILFASQFLIEDAASVLDHHQMTLLRSIESSSILLMQLIGDTLESPRAGSKKLRLQLERVEVAWLMEQIAGILQRIARGNNIRLEVTNDEAVALMLIDPLRMPQALTGVLTNAVRCSPPGGDIEVNIKAHPKRVVITVCFNRSADSTEDVGRGGGGSRQPDQEQGSLSLSPARRIVGAHGGRVRVQHTAGRSCFVLTLPRSRQTDAEPRGSGEPHTTGSRDTSKDD